MPARVSIFVTCIVDQLFPQAGIAMATVRERLGFDVHFPEAQTCCGQPAFNSGYRDDARTIARHTLRVLEGSDFVVVPSGSCTAMISHHYEELFEATVPEHQASLELSARVYEFSRFLVEVAKTEDVGAAFEGVVTYHDSCH